MGYLPEAMRNYLLRLGWGHGDDETISTAQAIEWFDVDGIGRSPSRFDMAKLDNLNGHYIRVADNQRLLDLITPRIEDRLGQKIDAAGRARLLKAMDGLKLRAKTVVELADNAVFYVRARPIPIDPKAATLLTPEARERLQRFAAILGPATEWTAAALEEQARRFVEAEGTKLGNIAQPLRAALAGATTSPGIFDVAETLGRDETLARLRDAGAA